jgi:hypothetical protein
MLFDSATYNGASFDDFGKLDCKIRFAGILVELRLKLVFLRTFPQCQS